MLIPILSLFLSVVLTLTSANDATLPTLSLPWGSYKAQVYENDSKIYIFRNVRFGALPERFGPSSRPQPGKLNDIGDPDYGDPNYGPSCIQIDSSKLRNPPGGLLRNFVGPPPSEQDEDCLFLDIYVPVSATSQQSLPVVVWFYGGAYAFGTKDINQTLPLYTGQSMLKATNYGSIFVAGNYRLGAFGWLAGNYMQNNKLGLPNAGLHDQALLLQWVHDFIHLVGGNNSQVSAWGESAGAGSILHHLIRHNGNQLVDPLFQTFLVQSPAFQWSWDNSPNGTLDSVYRNFSDLALCGNGYNITCLREQNISTLTNANQELYDRVPQTGLFPLGPSVDDSWITQIPALSFANNDYWTEISGALISHVAYEEKDFIPEYVDDENSFNDFLNLFLPGKSLISARQEIAAQYNCALSPWNGDYKACVGTVIRDSSFTCNTRQLFDAYSDRSYMLRFAFPWDKDAVHASDLVPTFMNGYTDAYNLYYSATKSEFDAKFLAARLAESVLPYAFKLQQKFQAYFASFALYGCPNKLLLGNMPTWPVANGAQDDLTQVLQINGDIIIPFSLVTDTQNSNTSCSFWTKIASSLESSEPILIKQGGPSS